MRRLFLLILALVIAAPMSMAQKTGVPFNGLVIDGHGNGISRMRVEVKGTDKRTVSDKMGRFGLTDIADDAVLVFRRKGVKVEIGVNGRRSLRVMLLERLSRRLMSRRSWLIWVSAMCAEGSLIQAME